MPLPTSLRLLLASTLLFLHATPAADPNDAAEVDRIDTIIVLGSRTPITPDQLAAAAAVIPASALRDAEAPFATDLLRTLPTAAISRSGGPGSFTQVRVRGAEAEHVQVRIDGFKVNDPALGSAYDFSHLRGPTIEAIELVAGPTGALWGSDAVAGTIHFSTPEIDGIELRGGVGSRRTREGTLGAGISSDRGRLTLIADHYDTRGENVSADTDPGGDPDGYTVTTVNLRGTLDVSPEFSVGATVRAFDADVEFDPTPAPRFVPADGDRESNARRVLSGVHLDWDPQGAWQHRLNLALLDSRHRDFADGARTDERRGRRYRAEAQSAVDFEALLPGTQRLLMALETEHERFIS